MWQGCILSNGFLQEGTSASGFKGCAGVNSVMGMVNGKLHSSEMKAWMLVLEERRGSDLVVRAKPKQDSGVTREAKKVIRSQIRQSPMKDFGL